MAFRIRLSSCSSCCILAKVFIMRFSFSSLLPGVWLGFSDSATAFDGVADGAGGVLCTTLPPPPPIPVVAMLAAGSFVEYVVWSGSSKNDTLLTA